MNPAQEDAAQENAAQENHVRGDESTRPMRTEADTEATYAERNAAIDGPAAAVVEERRIAPGSARGRLHIGINWGSAFFGWVAAMGLAVILTAFVAAVGAVVGVTRARRRSTRPPPRSRTRTRRPSASSASSCWR